MRPQVIQSLRIGKFFQGERAKDFQNLLKLLLLVGIRGKTTGSIYNLWKGAHYYQYMLSNERPLNWLAGRVKSWCTVVQSNGLLLFILSIMANEFKFIK